MTDNSNADKFDIEIGEDSQPSVCHCCNIESNIGHGFVYKNDEAYAIYYVGWATGHINKKVDFAVAVGEWDNDKTSDDRTCFGLEAYEGEDEILFRVIEPDESPWGNTELLGEMLSRKKALDHPGLKEIFIIIEHVIHTHYAIRKYLGI